jgi:hypothetical protein
MPAKIDNAIEAPRKPAGSATDASPPTRESQFHGTGANEERNVYSQRVTNRNRRKPPEISCMKIPARNKKHPSQSSSLTFVTFCSASALKQNDRHACRSKNAVTPCPSTKVPKLIDTLLRPLREPFLAAPLILETSAAGACIRGSSLLLG